jgi:hypothetical protein
MNEKMIHLSFVAGDGTPLMAELVERGSQNRGNDYCVRLHAMDRVERVYESPYSPYPYFVRLTWRDIVGAPLPKELIAEIAG